MIHIGPPDMKVKDILTASCAGMQDLKLKKKLLEREPDLSAAEQAYVQAAECDGLFTLAVDAQVAEKRLPAPQRKELQDLYSAGLVGRKHGRVKYDELQARAPYGHCLLCGNGEVSSLDHHLPKDSLPLYAICPANLVPACGKCNQAKGNRIGTVASQRTLHPYYDSLGEVERYLIADVQGWPVQFRIQPLAEWDSELSQRVMHHFRVFNLEQRFAEFSVSPLASTRLHHQKILRLGGPSNLAAHLQEDAEFHSSTHGLNHWGTALRYGLADSVWYADHGVNDAPPS